MLVDLDWDSGVAAENSASKDATTTTAFFIEIPSHAGAAKRVCTRAQTNESDHLPDLATRD